MPADPAPKPWTDPAAEPATIAAAVAAAKTSRMVPHEVAYLLAVAARVPAVLLVARTQLDTALFEPGEARFVLYWRGVLAAAEAAGWRLPADPAAAKELVALKCATEVGTDVGRHYYTPTVEQGVMAEGALLDELFGVPIAVDGSETLGMNLLARFVTERKLADPLRRAVAGLNAQDSLADPTALLAVLERHYREIAGFGVDPGSAGVVDDIDYRPPGPQIVSTMMRWLDSLMNGGHAAKEAYALLAPSGAGKSSLGVQLAVEGSDLQSALSAELGEDRAGHWYLFTWELDEPQLRERIYAYGARVHKDTFDHKQPYSTAARPETLKPYESEPYVNPPGRPPLGERERIQNLIRRQSGINRRLHIVDYSGTHPGHGSGGVAEVVAYLHREELRGRRVAGVVIDYAGLMVDAVLAQRRLRPDAVFTLLRGVVNEFRRHVSIPFDCPTWVLHQFHGDSTKRPPGVVPHCSEALGCRNFADNSDFAIQLSNYSKTTGLLAAKSDKHRRAPGREDGVIVRFDGRFGAFLDPPANEHYVVDPATKQIVPRDYLDALPAGPVGRPAPGPVDPRAGL